MKKFLYTGIFLSLFFAACKKSDQVPDPSPVPAPTASSYSTASANSVWYYQVTDTSGTPAVTNDTLTSTTRDTMVSSISYHVFANSGGNGNEYRRVVASGSGNDYIELLDTNLDGGTPSYYAYTFLKDFLAVGATWTQTTNVTINGGMRPATINNSIEEKGVSRTVNGQAYTDVIHVKSVLTTSVPVPPITLNVVVTTQSYYARKFGLIENSTIQTVSGPGFPAQSAATSSILKSAVLR